MHRKPHTEKAKRLISKAKKGKKRSPRTIAKVIKARMKPVQKMTFSGRILKVYPSVKDAEKHTHVDSSSIVKACKGILHTAGGYCWKYKPHV